jgi:hypothetical protein
MNHRLLAQYDDLRFADITLGGVLHAIPCTCRRCDELLSAAAVVCELLNPGETRFLQSAGRDMYLIISRDAARKASPSRPCRRIPPKSTRPAPVPLPKTRGKRLGDFGAAGWRWRWGAAKPPQPRPQPCAKELNLSRVLLALARENRRARAETLSLP